jgi:hypothetical protein
VSDYTNVTDPAVTVLAIDLQVKFRAFGITFGTVKEAWRIPLAVRFEDVLHVLPTVPPVLVDFDQRGVRLKVQVRVGGVEA